MDILFKYGFYVNNELFNVNAMLNTSFDYYKELKEVLHIKSLKDHELVRVGKDGCDGGYIMANDFKGNIAYSFGICDDVSWDSAMADKGYEIFMYDHTIRCLPERKDEFHFYQEGISGADETVSPLKTLKFYIERNGHSDFKNMILKMDVEGAEWDFLKTVEPETLKQFDQILFEFHSMVQTKRKKQIINMLKKINETHQLVHLHGNNSGYILKIGNTYFPDVMEATYVNKDVYETCEPEKLMLPLNIDSPNDEGRTDVRLGNWNEPLVIND